MWLLLLTISLNAQASLRDRLQGFQAGAHRGGMNHRGISGNSMGAFAAALRDGVDILEMDLRVSRDGVVYVIHDGELSARTTCAGSPESHSSQEIDACLYLRTQYRIPRFREVLDWAKDRTNRRGHIVVNAEFKNRESIVPSLALTREFNAFDWVYFQCSDPEEYRAARAESAQVALLFSPKNEEELNWALGLHDDNLLVIGMHDFLRTRATIERIHQAGKLISEDSFDRGSETIFCHCRDEFRDGIDIAISDQTTACARQREQARQ